MCCPDFYRGGGYCLNKIGLNIFQFAMAIKFSVFYYFGCYIYKKNYRPKLFTLISSTLISVGLFGIASALYGLQEANWLNLLIETLNCVCSIAGIVMVYSLVTITQEKMKILLRTNIWQSLKKCSFGVYLFHQQIVYLSIVFLNGRVHPIAQVTLGFVFSVLVSTAMVHLLRKLKCARTLFAL